MMIKYKSDDGLENWKGRTMEKVRQVKRVLLQAIKIAVGSSIAIYIAHMLGLEYEVSAGSIALLTLVTTKWETVKLAFYRMATFVLAVVLAALTFGHMTSSWLAYGIYVFLIVAISHSLGWASTISVNAVIGTHFLMTRDFSPDFIRNELLLVLIGVVIATILNLFYDYEGQKQDLIRYMRETENQLQMLLCGLAAYLHNKDMEINIWDRIIAFESRLHEFIKAAYDYQDNTFHSHPGYYIDYFEMRLAQLQVLHNLHYEIKKIRMMPKQALVIADYMMYMADYIVEMNIPDQQIKKLEEISEKMKTEEFPKTREEFEGRALLYHILMDLEEFLVYKKRFVNELDEKKLSIYWKQEMGQQDNVNESQN